MIYRYIERAMVQFSNKTRASYSKQRYGTLFEKIIQLSEELDRKIWNYFEFHDDECWIYYYEQKTQSEKIIIIDKEDWDLVKDYYWQLNVNGYPQTRTKGEKIFLYKMLKGDQLWDHFDHNPLNNRKDNLRLCDSVSDNNINQSLSSRNTSGVVGVSFIKRTNKWRARIQYKHQEKSKIFDTFEEAVACRKQWEKELITFND